jgi:hypothetical protein
LGLRNAIPELECLGDLSRANFCENEQEGLSQGRPGLDFGSENSPTGGTRIRQQGAEVVIMPVAVADTRSAKSVIPGERRSRPESVGKKRLLGSCRIVLRQLLNYLKHKGQ